MAERSPYEVLGVAPDASAEAIKKAYRRRSSEAHPDRQDGDARQMQEVNDAYALLSDPARRRLYDETGETGNAAELSDVAKGLLATELQRIVDGEAWSNPIAALCAGIERTRQEAAKGYTLHCDRLVTLKNRSRSFTCKRGSEDFLRPIFTRRIEECEASIKACEKLQAAAEIAGQLVGAYGFEDFLRAQALGAPLKGQNWLR